MHLIPNERGKKEKKKIESKCFSKERTIPNENSEWCFSSFPCVRYIYTHKHTHTWCTTMLIARSSWFHLPFFDLAPIFSRDGHLTKVFVSSITCNKYGYHNINATLRRTARLFLSYGNFKC